VPTTCCPRGDSLHTHTVPRALLSPIGVRGGCDTYDTRTTGMLDNRLVVGVSVRSSEDPKAQCRPDGDMMRQVPQSVASFDSLTGRVEPRRTPKRSIDIGAERTSPIRRCCPESSRPNRGTVRATPAAATGGGRSNTPVKHLNLVLLAAVLDVISGLGVDHLSGPLTCAPWKFREANPRDLQRRARSKGRRPGWSSGPGSYY
jgi:hypothetical protein